MHLFAGSRSVSKRVEPTIAHTRALSEMRSSGLASIKFQVIDSPTKRIVSLLELTWRHRDIIARSRPAAFRRDLLGIFFLTASTIM